MRSSTERPTTENPTTEHPTTEHLNHVRPKPRSYMDGKIGLFSDVGGFGQKSKISIFTCLEEVESWIL